MHKIEQRFWSKLRESQFHGLTLVVAISGGADSVALLRLLTSDTNRLAAANTDLVVAHFNHRSRPESDRDERFVRELAESLGLRFAVGQPSEPQAAASEDQWRQERYGFLTQLAHELGARYLLTGHTADDQSETVLFNVLRGSGLRGLCGIPELRQLDESLTLKRPLLTFERGELVRYLKQIDQAFVIDPSNVDQRFSRNQLRHTVFPQIEKVVPGDPREALLRLSSLAREWSDEIQPRLDAALDRALIKQEADAVELDCDALTAETPFVVREALGELWQRMAFPTADMSYAKRVTLAELVFSDHDSVLTLPGGIRARKRGAILQLASPDRP